MSFIFGIAKDKVSDFSDMANQVSKLAGEYQKQGLSNSALKQKVLGHNKVEKMAAFKVLQSRGINSVNDI